MKYIYYPQQMHIHSVYEHRGSMEGHIYYAALYGMRHIWFTEHDTLRSNRKRWLLDVNFEEGSLAPVDEIGERRGFVQVSDSNSGYAKICDTDAASGKYSMLLHAENESDGWDGCAVSLSGDGRRQFATLLNGLTLSLFYKTKNYDLEKTRLIIELLLSERPPEAVKGRIKFALGDTAGLDAPHDIILPLEEGVEWTKKVMPLTEITTTDEGMKRVFGTDNVLENVTIRLEARRGGSIDALIDDYKMEFERGSAETYEEQKRVAAEIGKKYGVTPFVTSEVSTGGIHKNCYSTNCPVIIYDGSVPKMSHEESCALMNNLDMPFSINHPFVRVRDSELTNEEYDALTNEIADEMTENLASGATLLEVGFPYGRYAPLKNHLDLWDILSLRGIILTGYGATDSHSMHEGWKQGVNNHATYFGVAEGATAGEEAFREAMRMGNGYSANPITFKGEVVFETESGDPMGSIIIAPECKEVKTRFAVTNARKEWRLRLIHNGSQILEKPLADGDFMHEFEIMHQSEIDFIRVEVYDENNILLIMTNPIYYVKSRDAVKNTAKRRIKD